MKKLLKTIAHFFYSWRQYPVTDAYTGQKEIATLYCIIGLPYKTTYTAI